MREVAENGGRDHADKVRDQVRLPSKSNCGENDDGEANRNSPDQSKRYQIDGHKSTELSRDGPTRPAEHEQFVQNVSGRDAEQEGCCDRGLEAHEHVEHIAAPEVDDRGGPARQKEAEEQQE